MAKKQEWVKDEDELLRAAAQRGTVWQPRASTDLELLMQEVPGSVAAAPLENLLYLVQDSVGSEDLVGDLATQKNIALVLPDGGDVARPQLQFVLLQDYGGLGVEVVSADQL